MSKFAIRNLNVLAYANGFTFWHYKAPGDAASDVLETGFFNAAFGIVAVDDVILVTGGCATFIRVKRADADGVDVETVQSGVFV